MVKQTKNKYIVKFANVIDINIENTNKIDLMNKINSLPFASYRVETLNDRRKIYISKPGGKAPFGNFYINDFMVWIYNEETNLAWRIGYKELLNDLKEKGEISPEETIKLYDLLELVLNGTEPNNILKETKFNVIGYPIDLILKTFKWLWAQEDCNYPTKRGRRSLWDGLQIKQKDGKYIYQEGTGMNGMRENLKKLYTKTK